MRRLRHMEMLGRRYGAGIIRIANANPFGVPCISSIGQDGLRRTRLDVQLQIPGNLAPAQVPAARKGIRHLRRTVARNRRVLVATTGHEAVLAMQSYVRVKVRTSVHVPKLMGDGSNRLI